MAKTPNSKLDSMLRNSETIILLRTEITPKINYLCSAIDKSINGNCLKELIKMSERLSDLIIFFEEKRARKEEADND